jgi:hypothetical protein
VVAKVRERLSASKRATLEFNMKRFNLNKLNSVKVKQKYQVKISRSFAALGNVDVNVNIDEVLESIRNNIKHFSQR